MWYTYWFEKNLQGDIVAVYNSIGVKLISYTYDAWGNFTTTYHNGASASTLDNPFTYRGYYYDEDLGLYYLNSRYYDSNTCRFINADALISGANGSLHGYNLYAYCFNNPIILTDENGNWPKWLTGALNIACGAMQMVAGVVLGATVGWTGVGAVAAGVLIANGAATTAQGIAQVVNDIAGDDILREDNILRSGAESIGEAIGGETGAEIAGYAYDTVVFAATVYSLTTSFYPKSAPQNPGSPFRPGVSGIQEGVNPNTLTPTKNLSSLSSFRMKNAVKYGGDQAITVTINGVILDGHHRVAYAIKHNKMVDVFVEIFK